jgi:hypothetical protein
VVPVPAAVVVVAAAAVILAVLSFRAWATFLDSRKGRRRRGE